jgi:hypothetical protein
MLYEVNIDFTLLFAHINLKPLQILNKKVRHIPALLHEKIKIAHSGDFFLRE